MPCEPGGNLAKRAWVEQKPCHRPRMLLPCYRILMIKTVSSVACSDARACERLRCCRIRRSAHRIVMSSHRIDGVRCFVTLRRARPVLAKHFSLNRGCTSRARRSQRHAQLCMRSEQRIRAVIHRPVPSCGAFRSRVIAHSRHRLWRPGIFEPTVSSRLFSIRRDKARRGRESCCGERSRARSRERCASSS